MIVVVRQPEPGEMLHYLTQRGITEAILATMTTRQIAELLFDIKLAAGIIEECPDTMLQ